MNVKYGVYLIRQSVTTLGIPVSVLGTLLGKFDTEQDAINFISNSPEALAQDCTIIKIYNNTVLGSTTTQ